MKIRVFENEGIESFRKYQLENEEQLLKPGGFYLVQSLLQLKNKIAEKKNCRSSSNVSLTAEATGVRVLKTIQNTI
jgi:5'-nucleotidase